MKDTSNRSSARIRSGLYSVFICLLAVAITVGVNLLATLLPEKARTIDLSNAKVLSLSGATVDYVSSLERNVTVYLVSESESIDSTILNVLKRYDELSDKLSVITVDPVARPAFVKKYTDKELENNSLITVCGERSKITDYYDMYSFALYSSTDGVNVDSHGNMPYSDFMTFYEANSVYFENYQTYGVGYDYELVFSGERVITSGIDYVVSDVFPSVYYTIGHGEEALPDSIVSSLETDNVNCLSLSIATEGKIPDDCSLIVINTPMSDISDKEFMILDAYMKSGGRLMLITSHRYTELKNLLSIAEKFGLTKDDGIIAEPEGDRLFSKTPTDILPITKNADSYLSLGAHYLIMPSSHPIKKTEKAENGELDASVSYTDLFVTSADSYILTDEEEKEDVKQASFTVGVLAKSNSSEFLWISSEDFLDSSVNTSSAGGNFIYAVAIIEKLCDKVSPFSIASKVLVEPSLTINSTQAGFWATVIVVIIPLLFVGVGIYIYRKRKNAR